MQALPLHDTHCREKRGKSSTSDFRGVTHHVRTNRWESHIWEDGKQLYLGGFDTEEQAALSYDLAATKFRGDKAATNFELSAFPKEVELLNTVTRDELVAELRAHSRQAAGKPISSSKYKGVTRHAKGRWEARIGASSRKYMYLGLFGTQEEAAMAYDREAVRQKGREAQTNFSLDMYTEELSRAEQPASSSRQQRGSADTDRAPQQASMAERMPNNMVPVGGAGTTGSTPRITAAERTPGFNEPMSLVGLQHADQQGLLMQMMQAFQQENAGLRGHPLDSQQFDGDNFMGPAQMKRRMPYDNAMRRDTKRSRKNSEMDMDASTVRARPRPRTLSTPEKGKHTSLPPLSSHAAPLAHADSNASSYSCNAGLHEQLQQSLAQLQYEQAMHQRSQQQQQQQQKQGSSSAPASHGIYAPPAHLSPITTSLPETPSGGKGAGSTLPSTLDLINHSSQLSPLNCDSPGLWSLFSSPVFGAGGFGSGPFGGCGAHTSMAGDGLGSNGASPTLMPLGLSSPDCLLEAIKQGKMNPFQSPGPGLPLFPDDTSAHPSTPRTAATEAAAAATDTKVSGSYSGPKASLPGMPNLSATYRRASLPASPETPTKAFLREFGVCAPHKGTASIHQQQQGKSRFSRVTGEPERPLQNPDPSSPSYLQCLIDQFSSRGTLDGCFKESTAHTYHHQNHHHHQQQQQQHRSAHITAPTLPSYRSTHTTTPPQPRQPAKPSTDEVKVPPHAKPTHTTPMPPACLPGSPLTAAAALFAESLKQQLQPNLPPLSLKRS
nr:apetala 2 [Dunaliella parva]